MMWHQTLVLLLFALLSPVFAQYPRLFDNCRRRDYSRRLCSLEINREFGLQCNGTKWVRSVGCPYRTCCTHIRGEQACGLPAQDHWTEECDWHPNRCPSGTYKSKRGVCRIPRSNTINDMEGQILLGKRTTSFECDETKGFCFLLSDEDDLDAGLRLATEAPEFDLPFDTRCDPNDRSQVQRFDGTNWVHHYTCDIEDSCLDVNGQGGCRTGNKVLIPAKLDVPSDSAGPWNSEASSDPDEPSLEGLWSSLLDPSLGTNDQASPRIEREDVGSLRPTRPHDLHSIDTRCNPANLTQVQRFNGSDWELHYVCPFEDSCKDVNGIGACLLKGNHYLLPAANDSTDLTRPLDDPPIVAQSKCSATNDTEVLAWNGTEWAFDKVCLSPYTCIDFHGAAGLAVCALPGSLSKQVWLPWAVPPNGTDSKSATTMCKGKRELLHWNGTDWAHARACSDGWSCRVVDHPPHNAGCFSPGVARVLKQHRHLAARNHPLFENAWSTAGMRFSHGDDSDDDPTSDVKKRLPPTFPKRLSKLNNLKARRVSSSATAEPTLSDDVEVVYVDPPAASPTPIASPPPPAKLPAGDVSEDERERCDGPWVGVHRCHPSTNEFQVCYGSRKRGGHWKKDGDCHKSGGFCVQKGKGMYQQAWCQLMDFDDEYDE
ncbi:hypothetical protein K491DRAFT_26044 [Lophiostoma macrostomum CBS 122681]|uniref:Cyanovirin-N domain-containing protein n=1 Tax=Lophiostoma macrostomum CBS 122681 TaxID=1314788 RepID=A0A6A6T259_9PLEO|nr:hypothetical protein K491DRAFT_26044 [Lophiostoma macrostomum CBS 122681]